MKTMKRSEIYDKLNANPYQFFGMTYIKANGDVRKATCRLHVQNPKHTQAPGTGQRTGQSAEDAYVDHNNLKYFDVTVEGKPGVGQTPGKGGYRTAKIDRIVEIRIGGEQYTIVNG